MSDQLRKVSVTLSDGTLKSFQSKNKDDLNLQVKMRFPDLKITRHSLQEYLCDSVSSTN
jgi:hypothetical protein